jgi:hypothetical protein
VTGPSRTSIATPSVLAWAALALVWLPATSLAAQSDAWVVDVRVTSGSLGADAARPVIEAARSEIASCTDGPGPHRFDYAVHVRANGQVREAAYDRGATSDPRAARCIRHALLELRFPAQADGGELALTLRAGEFEPSPPGSTTAPSPSAPPVTPVPGPGPIATPAPGPIPTPMPTPRPSDAPVPSGDVTIGVVQGTSDRTAAQLLSVITPQRAALTACFATARAGDASLSGDATLHLGLSPDGRVTSTMFQGPEALASALSTCVGQAARSWIFSATTAEARISVPLTFGGASRPVRR